MEVTGRRGASDLLEFQDVEDEVLAGVVVIAYGGIELALGWEDVARYPASQQAAMALRSSLGMIIQRGVHENWTITDRAQETLSYRGHGPLLQEGARRFNLTLPWLMELDACSDSPLSPSGEGWGEGASLPRRPQWKRLRRFPRHLMYPYRDKTVDPTGTIYP